ncbi:MAG: ATP-binding protein [Spirochaetales bacterium]|nr:ATP-binding protein [Spirochaetales bacterium]
MHFFNTAGPVNKNDHYCIDPLSRFDLSNIYMLVEQKKYMMLHAPRQTGKTSYLIAFSEFINNEGKYNCLYLNVEAVFTGANDILESMKGILFELASRARDYLHDTFPESIAVKVLEEKGPNLAFNELLTLWSKNSPKPIILLIDEIDALEGDVLGSILRQIRAGFDKRPQLFPQSIIFCGVEDIRYKRIADPNGNSVTGVQGFNVEAKSLKLSNFSREEIKSLFDQYTSEKNLDVEPEVFEAIWHLTRGQPWLVNALAYEICFEMVPRKQDIKVISLREVQEASENLIQRREIHLTNLLERLKEEKVKKIISPILTGEKIMNDPSEEDVRYLLDLGIINIDRNTIHIANDIYKEIIPRSLIYPTQLLIQYNLASYLDDNDELNLRKMLKAFQSFFNKYYERWVSYFYYKDAGPFLLLQAFLQRIIDGGGQIVRQYFLGRGRVTLLIKWPTKSSEQNVLIDMRYLTGNLKEAIKEGAEILGIEMMNLGIKYGHLVYFEKNYTSLSEQKVFSQNLSKGYTIDVWKI